MHIYNTIWFSTVPMTGTAWTFNTVREIFDSQKFNVLPKKASPSHDSYLRTYKDDALTDRDKKNRYVMCCHVALVPHLPRTKFITNIRNPYDNCASYYEFKKCSLEDAIKCAQDIPTLVQHYSTLGDERVFMLKFEDIDERPEHLIKKISKFLEVDATDETAKRIAEKYCRENVQLMIAKNDESLRKKLRLGQKIDEGEVIVREGGLRMDSFDSNTGYQSNHISKRKIGEWRAAFLASQIEMIIDALDETATMLGYESEKP